MGPLQPPDQFRPIDRLSRLIAYPDTVYTFISWNQLRGGKEFFRDQTVRQALVYGLNWDSISSAD